MTDYKLSDFGRLALEFEEGESEKPYKDLAGHWTIGKGHKLLPHEPHKNLKKEDINRLFDKDIADREMELNSGVDLILNQHQFDAIFILCFNIGVSKFLSSNIYKFLKKPDIISGFQSWYKWNKVTDPETGKKKVSKGLVSRREREINLFANDLKNINDYIKFGGELNGV
jgi:lysozyme